MATQRRKNRDLFMLAALVLLVGLLTLAGCPDGAKTYTLTTNASPPGAGSVSPSGGEYDSGVTVTLTATAANGYAFDHWSGSVAGTTPTTTITMDSDKSVTAHFEAVPTVERFTLTTNASPPGAGSVSPSGGEYDSGVTVTLTATAANGYAFDHWSGSAAGRVITTSIIMDADKSVTASFRDLLAEGILFEDYFDDDRNNWGTDAYIEDSALHFQLSAQGEGTTTSFLHKWPFYSPNYPNFGYEVDMTTIEAKETQGRGIIFLCDPAEDVERHWFIFVISGDGYYSLHYYQFTIEDGSDYRTVVGWTASNFINKGNSTNKLKVICRDFVIELYVNGHLLEEVHGEFPDNIGANGIGFFIQAAEETTHLVFDNMKMWVLD